MYSLDSVESSWRVSNYVVWYRIKRNVRYPKWKHVEGELSKIEKIMTGLAPHRDYLFCISIVSKTRGMGIGSPATSFRANDGNCECFLLERGGGEKGWDIQWKLEWHGIGETLSY